VAWSRYLAETAAETAKVVEAVLGEAPPAAQPGPSVRLTEFDPAGEDKVLTAIAYPTSGSGRPRWPPGWPGSGPRSGPGCWPRTLASGRNRRHRPGRAFERAVYTFDVVADYGAFRDLQRHRMCTIVWQPLTPGLGYDLPGDVAEAGLAEPFQAGHGRLGRPVWALASRFPAQAAYAVGPGPPGPVRYDDERPRADAPGRAALHPPGPPRLPVGRPADAPAGGRRGRAPGLAGRCGFVVHDGPGEQAGSAGWPRSAVSRRGWTIPRNTA
jgi:hypothetical protein